MLTTDRSPARRRRPSPQLAVKRAVSTKAVADSKISTDEVLKTIADKVRRLAPTPHAPRSAPAKVVPPRRKIWARIAVFAVVDHSLRSLTFPRPKPFVDPQWEDTENKSAVITYVAGGAALVWLSGTVVGAIGSIPILPKVMELVGLGYSTWFVYRYVLYKDSRKELVEQFDALKNKVSGEF